MAYFLPFTRVTFGGTIADGNDIWNCGFALSVVNGADDWVTSVNLVADDIKDLIIAFWTDPLLSTPSGATLDYVKFAHIDNDGSYVEAPIVKSFTPEPGALASAYVPQISTVVTLESDKYKDPGKYNRFYLPVANMTGAGVYQLPVIEQQRLADAAKTLFDGINALDADPLSVYVFAASNSSTLDSLNPIRKVKVGRVLDTQRRRRNKLNESYISEDLSS